MTLVGAEDSDDDLEGLEGFRLDISGWVKAARDHGTNDVRARVEGRWIADLGVNAHI